MGSVASAGARRLLVVLLSFGMTLSAMAAVPDLAHAQTGDVEVRIAPSNPDHTATRGGRQIRVSGSAPAGDIASATLYAITERGTRYEDPVPADRLNRGPAGTGEPRRDYLRNSGGTLDGELTLGCLYNEPQPPGSGCETDSPVRQVVLEVAVAGARGESEPLRIDFDRPFIRGYELAQRNRVRAVFSEPVRFPDDAQDSAVDWTVEGANVLSVEGPTANDCVGRYQTGEDAGAGATGCTRTLVLDRQLGEDARPLVNFAFSSGRLRDPYVDGAGNTLLRGSSTNAQSFAADLVRPRIPRIDSIDGKGPGGDGPRVLSNNRTPELRYSAATAGHRGFVRITRPNGDTFDTSASKFTVPAGSGPHAVALPTLGGSSSADGEYRVELIIEDPNGNRSDEVGKSGPGGDASPSTVVYDLLTRRPRLVEAFQTGTRELRVVLDRPVAPEGQRGRWLVDGQAATATGSGVTRTVRTSSDLTSSSTVDWAPSDGSTYRDAHGNELVPFTSAVATLPPLSLPTVTQPAAEVYQTAGTAAIGGRADSGLEVELYDRGAASPRATTTAADGRWSFSVSVSEGRHRFEVRTRRPDSDLRSAAASVPDIVRDATAPQVTVHEPSLRPLTEVDLPSLERRRAFAVGDPVTVEWTASDPAPNDDVVPDHGDRVDVAFTVGGQTRPVGPDRPYEAGRRSQFTYSLTEADRAAQSAGQASFTVTVTDLAGNVRSRASAAILIVGNLIGYTPVVVERPTATRGALIEARFAQPVQGMTLPFDWTVSLDDQRLPVVSTQRSERDGRTVITLEVLGLTDPNATPLVGYTEPRTGGLRGSDGQTRVADGLRRAVDGIAPLLQIDRPTGGPINAATVPLAGRTDQTARPNEIRVYRADAAGRRQGGPVARVTAGNDGRFQMNVPLVRNQRNRLITEAADPAGNTGPDEAFSVVEDSIAPVVTITNPATSGRIPRSVPLRWTTQDANPALADIQVRVNGSQRLIASRIVDEGRFDWDVDDDIDDDDIIEFRVRAIDGAGNDGEGRRGGLQLGPVTTPPPGGGAGPPVTGGDGIRVVATGERTIEVTFPSPVEVARGAAGFSVFGGPGVERVGGTGLTRTLVLNSDLSTTTPLVIYNGRGVSTLDGRPVDAFRKVADRGFAFAPQGLVGDSSGGAARLSWTDERNTFGDVVRYEITRDGADLGSVGGGVRAFRDERAGNGVRTYAVRTVDDMGHVSRAVSVRLDPNAPNITPRGGFVLSPDGQLALLVPAGAVSKDHFGRFEQVPTGGTAGYRAISGGYRLVVEAADDRSERLGSFDRFSCLSFRPGAGALAPYEPFRTMSLRLLDGDGRVEMPTRTGRASAEACLLTVGDFALGGAVGVTTRVSSVDPTIFGDRFATAVGLSQSSFAAAGTAVIARADDYPDALAASALAAQVGGPVLLSTTQEMPRATVLELRRLGAERVVLVGGDAALADSVATQAARLGLAVERVAGATRFETAAQIGQRVGAFGGRAFMATGQNFADALAGAAPSSMLTRPILLTAKDALPASTVAGLRRAGVSRVTLLGGDGAVSPAVEQALRAEGFATERIAGTTRFETAIALADALRPEGLLPVRPIAATGQGDGKTSPDALASGPIAGRFSSPLMLVPRDALGGSVTTALSRAEGLRGVVVAGGTAAVSDRTRSEIDAATR